MEDKLSFSTEYIVNLSKKKKMSDIRLSWEVLKFNKRPTALFAVLYTILSVAASTAIVYYSFYLSLKVCGFDYVGNGTIVELLKNPLVWLIGLVCGILLTFMIIVEVGGLITDFGMALCGIKAPFWAIVKEGLLTAKNVGKPENFLMIPFVLLLIPFTGVMAITNAGMTIGIPGFINDFISKNQTLSLLAMIAIVILCLVAMTFIFVLSVFTLENTNFIPACKKGKKIMKDRFFRFYFRLFLNNLLLYATILLIIILFSIVFLIAVVFLSKEQSRQVQLLDRGVQIITLLTLFVGNLIAPVLNMAYLSAMHVRYEEEKELLPEEFVLSEESYQKLSRKQKGTIILVCAGLLLAGLSVRSFDSYFNNTINTRPLVVAHRGDSINAPENSYAAFELAILGGCSDGVELDVHQTKDGVVIVSHDDYLERISGERVYVHELTYEELQKLEVGSWFSEEYRGIKIPTLKEVLELCKDQVDVQVEIKPTKYDQDLEQAVLDIIKEVGSENETIILSLKQEPLIRARQLDDKATLMYGMYLGEGAIEKIPYVNALSLEESLISRDLVNRIHRSGKRVFVWTINSENNLQYLVDCGVDGILTDDPIAMDEWLDSIDYSGGFLKLIRTLLPKFE